MKYWTDMFKNIKKEKLCECVLSAGSFAGKCAWRFYRMTATIDVNNLMEVRKIGLQALKEALGPVGMIRFIQQYENGSGDYTEEKYQKPDLTIEEVDMILKNR